MELPPKLLVSLRARSESITENRLCYGTFATLPRSSGK